MAYLLSVWIRACGIYRKIRFTVKRIWDSILADCACLCVFSLYIFSSCDIIKLKLYMTLLHRRSDEVHNVNLHFYFLDREVCVHRIIASVHLAKVSFINNPQAFYIDLSFLYNAKQQQKPSISLSVMGG